MANQEKSWERATRPFEFNYAKQMSEADYAACEIPDFLKRTKENISSSSSKDD